MCSLLVGLSLFLSETSAEHLALLREQKIGTETGEILAFLDLLLPGSEANAEIQELIGGLSSLEFEEREAATAKLQSIGMFGRANLIEATKSSDPETAWRTKRILGGLDSDERHLAHRSAVFACLEILKERGDPVSVPTLLLLLGRLDEPTLRGRATEAIWKSADATHADLFQKAMDDKNTAVVAAAIVGLEISQGEGAVDAITSFLKSEHPALRLAAARALVDRQPEAVIEILLGLLADRDDDFVWQADAILGMLAGKRPKGIHKSLEEMWREWSLQEDLIAKLDLPLGARRHDLTAGRKFLSESFLLPAATVAKGYRQFEYEADNGGKASVADGMLLLDGQSGEGDQRLFITSRRMLGREEWPDRLDVRAKLGGKEGNDFGRHVGVSIGRVKALFHPGSRGGAFRAETTDTHGYIFGNEDMPFTPRTDVLYEMWIVVERTMKGADFSVTVEDSESDAVYTREFSVTKEQLGDFNRVGLERSGRTGGDAMFGSLFIQLER